LDSGYFYLQIIYTPPLLFFSLIQTSLVDLKNSWHFWMTFQVKLIIPLNRMLKNSA